MNKLNVLGYECFCNKIAIILTIIFDNWYNKPYAQENFPTMANMLVMWTKLIDEYDSKIQAGWQHQKSMWPNIK